MRQVPAAGEASPSRTTERERGAVEPRRPSRWVGALLTSSLLTLALAATLSLVPLPYAVMSPGPVTNTLGTLDGRPIVEVDSEADPGWPRGQLYFTTVRVEGGPGQRITVFDLIGAALDGSEDVYPEEELYPKDSTREQVREESAAEMEGSQQVAAAVAARAAGLTVGVHTEVSGTVDDSPAAGVFTAGDVIVSVDGTPTAAPVDVRTAVRARRGGDTIDFVVQRAGAEVPLSVVAADRDGVATIGVLMTGRYDLPVDVTVHAGAVGGPSAGMMFSLAIYDALTPGVLPGDAAIAGTGTLADDGSVGPIGGIRQKVIGARDGGATWFLAPAENCADLGDHVPEGLHVVKVSTFSEALGAVRAIAAGTAEDLPGCAP